MIFNSCELKQEEKFRFLNGPYFDKASRTKFIIDSTNQIQWFVKSDKNSDFQDMEVSFYINERTDSRITCNMYLEREFNTRVEFLHDERIGMYLVFYKSGNIYKHSMIDAAYKIYYEDDIKTKKSTTISKDIWPDTLIINSDKNNLTERFYILYDNEIIDYQEEHPKKVIFQNNVATTKSPLSLISYFSRECIAIIDNDLIVIPVLHDDLFSGEENETAYYLSNGFNNYSPQIFHERNGILPKYNVEEFYLKNYNK